MGIKIKKFFSAKEAACQTGQDLSKKLNSVKKSGRNSLLLFSGGSAFSVLDYIGANALGNYLTICLLDERYDSGNQNNNFIQLTKTDFYRLAKKNCCHFINTSVKGGQTQKQLANYFERELKNWKRNNKKSSIFATVGMGADGHIAGIMPFPENDRLFKKLFCGKNWIASYDAKDKNPHRFRITTTITFLKLIDRVFGFICGKEKTANFNKITSPGKISELPCRALKKIKDLKIYTDIK